MFFWHPTYCFLRGTHYIANRPAVHFSLPSALQRNSWTTPEQQPTRCGPSPPLSRQPNRSDEAIAHVVYALCSIVLHSGLPLYLGSALPGGRRGSVAEGYNANPQRAFSWICYCCS